MVLVQREAVCALGLFVLLYEVLVDLVSRFVYPGLYKRNQSCRSVRKRIRISLLTMYCKPGY